MGICIILVVCLSVYTVLIEQGVEKRDIDCSIGAVLVHTLFVTCTVWVFLDVLNGAYCTAGLEGRLKGIGLNKIVIALHVFPFLVFLASMIYTLVEHKDATTIEVGGVRIRNGTRKDDNSKCWVNPVTYWLTWTLPAGALFLVTCCTLIYIAHHCNVKWRVLNCCSKGNEVEWIRHTFFTTFLYCTFTIAATFADCETSSHQMAQQSVFSLSLFLFSVSILYCWVVTPTEIYFFWANLGENISLSCFTCGWCVLEYKSEKSRSPVSVGSSMFVNTNLSGPADVEALSLISSSSACSGDLCRHVNQKCTQGKVTIMIDDYLVSTSSDPEIAGVDRKQHKPEYVDPEIFGIARKKGRSASTKVYSDEDDDVLSDEPDFLGAGYESRARRASRVSFSDIVVVNEHGQETPELSLIVVSDPKEIKPIYHRSSSDNTPSSADISQQHDDTPIPSPEKSETSQPPPPGPVRYLSNEGKLREEISPTDSEKAAQVKSTLEKQVTRVTHAAVMEQLLSEVEESSVYRPQRAELQDNSSFSEHLRKLMADYEKKEASLSRSSSQITDSESKPQPSTLPTEAPAIPASPTPIQPAPLIQQPVAQPVPQPAQRPAVTSAPPMLDILYPLRVSSSESSTPTVPGSVDEFATPPEGGTPEFPAGVTSPKEGTTTAHSGETAAGAAGESPVNFFKPVFGNSPKME
ncbi:hypothetical protein ACHWQZ_G004134 [Mnemiopsis leidyi]